MNKNFVLADAVAIQVGDEYYDLHNCFDLVGVAANFTDREVRFRFMSHDRVGSDVVGRELTISFSNVDYFDVSPGVLKNMVRDVAELGYKNPDDFDHDWLIAENKINEDDHLFLRLAGDEFIRIHGHSAILTCEKPLAH